jgi:hypothetical protein
MPLEKTLGNVTYNVTTTTNHIECSVHLEGVNNRLYLFWWFRRLQYVC